MANVVILHNPRGIHYVHNAWVQAIGAKGMADVHPYHISIPIIPRLFTTIVNLMKVPKNTDVLICESGSYIFTGVFWKALRKSRKLVLILADPKLHYLSKKGNLIKKLYAWALGKFDLIIAVSPLMASYVPDKLKHRVAVVPTFGKSNMRPVRLDMASRNIIFMARICKEKGTDLLVDAFAKLRQAYPDSRLYVVGVSTYLFGQGNMRKILESKKIPGAIFTGRVPSVEDYMEKCSIYASMARIDPAPVSILEAMSQGLIPVVSRGVGNSYAVEEIDPSLVVDKPEDAVLAITKLWSSPLLMREYSRRAREIAEKYSKEFSTGLFVKAIAPLLG